MRSPARCAGNLERIETDSQKLNLSEPREYYQQAEHLQQKQYYDAVRDRDAVYWAIKRIQAALGSSGIWNVPMTGPYSVDPPVYSPSPRPEIHPGGIGGEAEDLLSMGPLGEDPSRR